MSIVAHSSFRLNNNSNNNNADDEVVLVVSDNMDDLFAMENAQQTTSDLVDAVRAPPTQASAPPLPLLVTEELLRLVIDPISLDIMMDPVLAGDHYTYDRQSITKWLAMKGATPNPHGYVRLPKVPSPCTGQDLVHHNLTPNVVVKNLVQLVVAALQQQAKEGSVALPTYHDEMLRDYLSRQEQLKRAQRTAENLKKLYGAHCCPQNHPMTLIRCGALPRSYETSGRGLDTVTCSCCDHGHIAEINWYFHCSTCSFYNYPVKPSHAARLQNNATHLLRRCFSLRYPPTSPQSLTSPSASASASAARTVNVTGTAAATAAPAPAATSAAVVLPADATIDVPSESVAVSAAPSASPMTEPTVQSLASRSRSMVSDAVAAAIAAAVDAALTTQVSTSSSSGSEDESASVVAAAIAAGGSSRSRLRPLAQAPSSRRMGTASQRSLTTATATATAAQQQQQQPRSFRRARPSMTIVTHDPNDALFFAPIAPAMTAPPGVRRSTGHRVAQSMSVDAADETVIAWPEETVALMERETRSRRGHHQRRLQQNTRSPPLAVPHPRRLSPLSPLVTAATAATANATAAVAVQEELPAGVAPLTEQQLRQHQAQFAAPAAASTAAAAAAAAAAPAGGGHLLHRAHTTALITTAVPSAAAPPMEVGPPSDEHHSTATATAATTTDAHRRTGSGRFLRHICVYGVR
eukprot:gene7889-5669_t